MRYLKPMTDLSDITNFAEQLADAAASAILPFFRERPQVDDKGADGWFDPVTEADKAAERAMRQLIEATFPAHGILGEEEDEKPGSGEGRWVLDPIDGTRAFMSGLPTWGTLIAFDPGSGPAVGIIDQPYMKERWVAGPEGGRFDSPLGERALKTSDCTSLDDAILMATHPEIFVTSDERAGFDAVASRVKLLRWGGDCYSYGLVALGLADLVIEANLKPFDIQAIIPIVTAAGGVITDWQGGSADNGGQVVAAATPALHAEALKLLNV